MVMNGEKVGRRQPWHISKYYPDMSGILRKIMKILK
jgi:hypothetical protein